MLAHFRVRVALCGLIAVALSDAKAGFAQALKARVILDDQKARVTVVEVPADEGYALEAGKYGSVWVALGPFEIISTNGDVGASKRILAGDFGKISSGEKRWFRVEGRLAARLVLIDPKTLHQELTVGAFPLDVQDGSDRNDTLLVAVSDCHFRDIRNLGDESEWKPGEPEIIAMKSGTVRWVRAGIHHFKNLGSRMAKAVSIEW